MNNRYSALPIPFGWYVVAYSHELAPGDVKPLHYFDEQLVLFRGESGQAQAMEAYCPHLGAHLGHGGKVQGDDIACPFHAWQFNREGVCTTVPYARQVPPKIAGKPCLYSYPTEEKNGAIWVWYHPERKAPVFDLVEHTDIQQGEWTPFRYYDWVIRSHIQETGENAVDGAHFLYVHGSASMPQGTVDMQGHQRTCFYRSRTRAFDENGVPDDTGTRWIDSELMTANNGPGQTWQRFTGVCDTYLFGMVTPIDGDTVHLRFAFTQPASQTGIRQAMAEGYCAEIARQVEQDIPIWENKRYAEHPTLCDGDGPIHQYRKWFQQFYAA